MQDRGPASNSSSDRHPESTVAVLSCEIHDFHRDKRIFLDKRVAFTSRTAHRSLERHGLIPFHELVVFLSRVRVRQRLKDEVEAAHLLVSPRLLFRWILVGV